MPRLHRWRTRFIMAGLLVVVIIVVTIGMLPVTAYLSTADQSVPSATSPYGTPAPTCGPNNPPMYNRWDGCVDHR